MAEPRVARWALGRAVHGLRYNHISVHVAEYHKARGARIAQPPEIVVTVNERRCSIEPDRVPELIAALREAVSVHEGLMKKRNDVNYVAELEALHYDAKIEEAMKKHGYA